MLTLSPSNTVTVKGICINGEVWSKVKANDPIEDYRRVVYMSDKKLNILSCVEIKRIRNESKSIKLERD